MSRVSRTGCWVIVIVVALLFVATIPRQLQGVTRLKYSVFLSKVESGEIASVIIENQKARGEFTDPSAVNGQAGEYYVELSRSDAEIGNLLELLRSANQKAAADGRQEIVFDTPAPFVSEGFQQVLFSVFLPLGTIVLLWVLFWRQAQRARVSSSALQNSTYGVRTGRRRRRVVIRRPPPGNS